MASSPQINLADKLMVVPNLSRSLASAITRILTRPFSSGPQANTAFKDILFAALRTNLSIVSEATEQWMNPSTESGYLDLAKSRGFQPDTDVLSDGLKLFWLGKKSAEKVLLYCHGGGYALSASPGHFAWLFDLQNDLAKDHDISIVVIGYTLSPYAKYPTQLKQAAESLEWLLTTQKKKAGNIVLAGDSAGGNMALALLSHLLHPHPDVKPTIQLNEPLASVILISPWTKFGTDDESVKQNATSDYVTPEAANRWSSMFLGSKPSDNYNQPILADAAWFKDLQSCVKDILIWGGGGEILMDSIEVIAKKLKEAHPRTELVVQPGVSHEDFIIDRLLGYKDKAEGTKLIQSWVAARL